MQTFGLTTSAPSGTYPFTLGLAFRKGEFPASAVLDVASYQVVPKRRWSDGSLKHAVVSGHVALTQNVMKMIAVTPGTSPARSALTIAPSTISASVQCGSYGTVSLSSLLAMPVRTWVSGPEMVERHYRSPVGPDKTLAVWFHVRWFADGRSWIRAIVENGNLDNGAAGISPHADKTYAVTVTIGGAAVYTGTVAHYRNTRYCAEGWIGADPQVTPKHDAKYLNETKLVPNYGWRNPTTKLNELTQRYTPMARGDLTQSMGVAGYQRQIGILPEWDALYCTSTDPRAYRAVLANSSHLNSYPIVWRDARTHAIPKPSDFRHWSHQGPSGGGTNDRAAGPLVWEIHHHPSEGYLSYLITGDYWHYETMAMQASVCYLFVAASRGSGTERLLAPGSPRGNGWIIRTLGQYAAIAPDGDPVAADYRALLDHQFARWAAAGPKNPKAKQLGAPYAESTYNEKYPQTVPPWQYDFWIASQGHVWDAEPGMANTENFRAIRDWMYKFVIGRLGGSGPDNYCFTQVARYTICIQPAVVANFTWVTPDKFWSTWGEVWRNSVPPYVPNAECGNTLDSGAPGIPLNWSSYVANMLPAISYAVDHEAPGAKESWARLTGASNWPALANSGFDNAPVWGITPRAKGAATVGTVSDLVTKLHAFYHRFDKAIVGIQGDSAELNDEIQRLRSAPGIAPGDRIALDALQAQGQFIATRFDVLDSLAAAPLPSTSATKDGATLSGSKWTPRKDAAGNILQAEWDGLPLNTWIELTGSALRSQLSPPFGAAAGYVAPGLGGNDQGLVNHYQAFTSMGWDEENGRSYHFGGGSDGGNNMLSSFDLANGRHSVVIPPTHQSMHPPGYTKNLAWVIYPSGRGYNYFPTTETPKGDGKPAASHEYNGIVFVPERKGQPKKVLLARFGWFEAFEGQDGVWQWREGPQTTEATRQLWKNRSGIAFNAHYVKSTGLVYLTSESSQIAGSPGADKADWTAVAYDPAKRIEVGSVSNFSSWLGTSCLKGDEMWYFGKGPDGTLHVNAVNLRTGAVVVPRTKCSGRVPQPVEHLPVEYCEVVDKMFLWSTAQPYWGEMLEFNWKTLTFSTFALAGAAPAVPHLMFRKMRYWPKQKVLLFQLAVNANAHVVKLA